MYVTLNSPTLRNFDNHGLFRGAVLNLFKASQDSIFGLQDGRLVRWAFYHPNHSGLKKLRKLAEDEKIKPVIDEIFTIDRLADAYKKVKEGHLRGKTVIQIQ